MGILRLVFVLRCTLVNASRLMVHASVPLRLKLLALALGALILSPLNILGDIPVLGIVDDVALLGIMLGWFVNAASPHVAAPVWVSARR